MFRGIESMCYDVFVFYLTVYVGHNLRIAETDADGSARPLRRYLVQMVPRSFIWLHSLELISRQSYLFYFDILLILESRLQILILRQWYQHLPLRHHSIVFISRHQA